MTELDKSLANTTEQKSASQQKNNNETSLRVAKNFKHVTESQSHGLHTPAQLSPITILPTQLSPEQKAVLEMILDEIKSADGSQVSVNAVIISAYSKSKETRCYLGDKLTSRENRKVRDLCLLIIRHLNIEVIKPKPQLIVRWSSSSLQTEQQTHDAPLIKHENAKVSIDEGARIQ